MTTPVLGADELAAAQNIPETTVNGQIRRLEQMGYRGSVKDRTNTPPGSPADGDAYLVTATATGAWTGWENSIAYRQSTSWLRIQPKEGMELWVHDEDLNYTYYAAAWNAGSAAYTAEDAQDAVGAMVDGTLTYTDATPALGVNTTAEAERIRDVIGTALVAGANVTITVNDGADTITIASSGGGGGGTLADGDYGDVVVSGTGTVMTLDSSIRVGSGSSFPGSPSTGDRFYRTDRHIEYFYDGTRWLSAQIFTGSFQQGSLNPVTVSDTRRAALPYSGVYDIYLETCVVVTLNTAVPATNHFTLQFRKRDAAAVTNLGSAITTSGDVQNEHTMHRETINAVVTSTHEVIDLTASSATGSPSMMWMPSFTYRLVG